MEILHNDQWGTVCDDDWDIREGQVVCRAMDCGSAKFVKPSAYFGPGEGDIWLDDVRCVGNESTLLHCQHPALGENNCGHGEDAGVVCSGILCHTCFVRHSNILEKTPQQDILPT